jgi:hypothetical protein
MRTEETKGDERIRKETGGNGRRLEEKRENETNKVLTREDNLSSSIVIFSLLFVIYCLLSLFIVFYWDDGRR